MYFNNSEIQCNYRQIWVLSDSEDKLQMLTDKENSPVHR